MESVIHTINDAVNIAKEWKWSNPEIANRVKNVLTDDKCLIPVSLRALDNINMKSKHIDFVEGVLQRSLMIDNYNKSAIADQTLQLIKDHYDVDVMFVSGKPQLIMNYMRDPQTYKFMCSSLITINKIPHGYIYPPR